MYDKFKQNKLINLYYCLFYYFYYYSFTGISDNTTYLMLKFTIIFYVMVTCAMIIISHGKLMKDSTSAPAEGWSDEKLQECYNVRKTKFSPNEPYDNVNKIVDKLWIGNICIAANRTFLFSNNINLVINMASEWDLGDLGWKRDFLRDENIDRFYIDLPEEHIFVGIISAITIGELKDRFDDKNVKKIFDSVSKMMNSWISLELNVLVVCNIGKSRSVSAVIQYLINRHIPVYDVYGERNMRINYNFMLNKIKMKRPIAQPNSYYEHILKGLPPPIIHPLPSSTGNEENVKEL